MIHLNLIKTAHVTIRCYPNRRPGYSEVEEEEGRKIFGTVVIQGPTGGALWVIHVLERAPGLLGATGLPWGFGSGFGGQRHWG